MMKEMKKHNVLFMLVLFIASTLMYVSIADSQFSIRIEKDLPYNQITPLPTTLTINLWDANTTTMVATQDYLTGQWEADYDFSHFKTAVANMVRFKVDFTNTGALTSDMDLWVEMKFDGVTKGPIVKIKQEARALFSEEAAVADTAGDADTVDGMHASEFITTETDPVFSAWDKSTGISITESQVGNLRHFNNTDETDPTVPAGIKDGIEWTEVTARPAGLDDGDDSGDTDWTIYGTDIYAGVSGNVGIGTTTPTSKLDVSGDINTDSFYRLGGTTVFSVSGQDINQNTFIGSDAGLNATNPTFARSNTFIGNQAAASFQTGDDNVVIGALANLDLNSNASVIIGARAGSSNTGSGNIFIGHSAGANEAGFNKLYIDNSDTLSPLIHGDFMTDMVTITDTLKITPVASAPQTCNAGNAGAIYHDSTTPSLCWCNGTAWLPVIGEDCL